MDKYEGGFRRDGTFIELCKSLIDSINARWNGLPRTFADQTFSMSFYDSVVAFEKMTWSDFTSKTIMIPSDTPPVNIHGAKDAISRGVHSGRVFLYGIGGHTDYLLNNIGKDYVSKITALLTNDHPGHIVNEHSIPNGDTADLRAGDTVIISSYIYQDIISDRIRHLMEHGINIVKLY